jgi:hypothetical protein
MVLAYGAAGGNAVQAQILYRELFYLLLVILINNLIGKHILPNRLNSEEYLRFLSDTLPELLDEVPLDIIQGICYLHDGAPPHYARQFTQWWNQNYPELDPEGGLDESVERFIRQDLRI